MERKTRNSILCIALLTLMACGAGSGDRNIDITVEGGGGRTVYFNRFENNRPVPVDSVKLDSDGKGTISTRDATQIAVGYQYDLSKRTAVYGTFARVSNDGSATYVIGGGAAGQVAGKDSTGFEVGVRHTF